MAACFQAGISVKAGRSDILDAKFAAGMPLLPMHFRPLAGESR